MTHKLLKPGTSGPAASYSTDGGKKIGRPRLKKERKGEEAINK